MTNSDNNWFDSDVVNKTTKEVVETIIGSNTYQHSEVTNWSNTIVEQVMQQLVKNNNKFKYIVTCAIIQKNGAGLQTATSCYWDNTTDGYTTVRWENKSLHSIVQIFAVTI
ncbi:dynein light chain Tctex-type 1-like [Oppia nitens]|uniref:dynein light chain Tctex-type 1-like n=1 Tax=Oppia nitens TaxID=1686743 RepID=UPI0023DBC100|nr:dynein light chain Tctex-type 1-like [Oppia nitens]